MKRLLRLAGSIDWGLVLDYALALAMLFPVFLVLWLLYIGLWAVLG